MHRDSLSAICARTFGNWQWVSNQLQPDSGVRIVIAWDFRIVDVMLLECHNQFIHCEIRIKGSQVSFFMTYVYGVNKGMDRRSLWSGL